MTLTPADWGPVFTQGDPYEYDAMLEQFTDHECRYVTQPVLKALTSLRRLTQQTGESVIASSSLIVYETAGAAQADVDRRRDDTSRCATVQDASSERQWTGIGMVEVPALKGFDQIVTEEGRETISESGEKKDGYYSYFSGRKGQFLMTAYVARDGTQEQNRERAAKALQLMLSRLP